MKDGKIEPSRGAPFGFTDDWFSGYLWKVGDDIYISLIESLYPGKGHFRTLIRDILNQGYVVKIPTPLVNMERILRKNDFKKTFEKSEVFDEDVEVWVKHPGV